MPARPRPRTVPPESARIVRDLYTLSPLVKQRVAFHGADGIWVGVGMSTALLVTWVPQHKAAALLLVIHDVLAGRCTVSRYRSAVGALQDMLMPTGGGMYRMKGLYAPLADDAELGEGPDTIVRVRRQMRARLVCAGRACSPTDPGRRCCTPSARRLFPPPKGRW